MNLFQNKRLLACLGVALTVISVFGYRWLSYYITPFKIDNGMTGTTYAGQYVKTGKWVFDCNNGRLISRIPLAPPMAAFEKNQYSIAPSNINPLSGSEKAIAAQLINTLTHDDYEKLQYRFSMQDDSSVVWVHSYYLIKHHAERDWAIEILQFSWSNSDSFRADARPYNPAEYVDHAKALSAALVSCPSPQ
ncbi:hypothetical protein [Pseudomonas sp. NPDC089406]|uniref:hypothetical protein n=1 Tax=Pseudomonas sp. NPDC089406 TaxID=3364463 RepID=UPI00384E2B59